MNINRDKETIAQSLRHMTGLSNWMFVGTSIVMLFFLGVLIKRGAVRETISRKVNK